MSNTMQSLPGDASATARGVVNKVAQVFAGPKTFIGEVIASAGVRFGDGTLLTTASTGGGGIGTVTTLSVATANGVSGSVANPTTTPAITVTLGAITPSSVQTPTLFNTNGGVSTDVAVVLGTSVAYGTVDPAGSLLSVRTGIGGAAVESLSIRKDGVVKGGLGLLTLNDSVGAVLSWNGNGFRATGSVVEIAGGSVPVQVRGLNSLARLMSNLGAGAADLATAAGTSALDGATSPTAKLFVVQTGIGVAPVDKAWFTGTGQLNIVQTGINIPSITLAGGAGGYAYGGGLQMGGQYQGLYYTGTSNGIHLQSYGASVPVGIQSFDSFAFVAGYLQGSLGAAAVAVKVGTKIADGAIDPTARLLTVRTSMGGTEAEKFYVSGGGNAVASGTVTGSNLSGANTGDQTITLTGDVTGSGTGSFTTSIAAATVTLAKMANIATATVLGRATAGTGAPEALTLANGIGVSGGALILGNITPAKVTWLNSSAVAKATTWYDTAGGRTVVLGDTGTNPWLYISDGDGVVRATYGIQTAQGVNATGAIYAGSLMLNPFGPGLSNDNGLGATDIALKLGTRLVASSVHATAKLLSLRAGLGGTEVEKLYVSSSGFVVCSGLNVGGGDIYVGGVGSITPGSGGIAAGHSAFVLNLNSGWALADVAATECFKFFSLTNFTAPGAQILTLRNGDATTGIKVAAFLASGVLAQIGNDSGGAPGTATSNTPAGINAIATGDASVTVYNSLIPDPTVRRVRIHVTPHGLLPPWWVEQLDGKFILFVSGTAASDVMFSWEIGEIIA